MSRFKLKPSIFVATVSVMTDERRSSRRTPVLIDLSWEGKAGRYQARTTDLSEGGCFVDTIGRAVVGEQILFKFQLPSGEGLEIGGEVTFSHPMVGFGVKFKNLPDGVRQKLAWLVKAGTYNEDKRP